MTEASDRLVFDGFNPEREGLREALCTLGNGYFATRGAAPESVADEVHYPGTYAMGCYNRLCSEIAGKTLENEDLVNLPNWLPLDFRIDGGLWFDLRQVRVVSHRLELDLRNGVLTRTCRFQDGQSRTTSLRQRRLVHMGQPHLAALETRVTAEDWTGVLEVRSALDGRICNNGVARYRGLRNRHLAPLETRVRDDGIVCLEVETSQSRIRIAEAARLRVHRDGAAVAGSPRTFESPGYVARHVRIDVEETSSVTLEKIAALYTSRDHAISECGLEACNAVRRAAGFDDLLRSHQAAWATLWRRFHIEFEDSDPEMTSRSLLVLRLHIFHLLQTASPNTIDLDAGIPARGLHGEAYRGHVFWDEIFIFPMLNFRMPEITRSLLMYRYRRLGEARAAAAGGGFRGALFPWQSASNGREETQKLHLNPHSGRWIPDNTHLQRHVNLAIAYNVWQYHQVTGDLEFLVSCGAEMVLEIARLFAGLAHLNEDLGRYEILGVIGPDEYHERPPGAPSPGVDNNAYTNIMAALMLWRALQLLDLLPEDHRQDLCDKLALTPAELERWDAISRKMRVVFHDDGIISQFEGYEALEEFDWDGYRLKYGDIHRLDRILESEGDDPNRYKLSKQADVLMLFYLLSSEELSLLFQRLGYPFAHETIPRNIEYYLHRTSHGSTLSRVVHSWVLARSDRERSWKLFTEALESDLGDLQGGTTAEGIHLGAMAGTVDLVQRGYTGIEPRDDVLWFNPCLPQALRRLALGIRYRGHSLQIELTHDRLTVTALRGTAESIEIGVKGQLVRLATGETRSFDLSVAQRE
jgi:alpha,alpha-trehalase